MEGKDHMKFGKLERVEYYDCIWEYYYEHDVFPDESDVRSSDILPPLTDFNSLFGSLEQCKRECGAYSEEVKNEVVGELARLSNFIRDNDHVHVDYIPLFHVPYLESIDWYRDHFGNFKYAKNLAMESYYDNPFHECTQ